MYLPYSFDGLTVALVDGIIIRMKVCLDTGESNLFSLSLSLFPALDVESEVFQEKPIPTHRAESRYRDAFIKR